MASSFFSFNWHGDGWFSEFNKTQAARLETAAIHLENKVKEKLGQKCPAYKDKNALHSPPDGPPYLETGELRRSITHVIDRDKLKARVGTNKKYARFLEKGTSSMQARPFLHTTLEEEWPTIQRIMKGQK